MASYTPAFIPTKFVALADPDFPSEAPALWEHEASMRNYLDCNIELVFDPEEGVRAQTLDGDQLSVADIDLRIKHLGDMRNSYNSALKEQEDWEASNFQTAEEWVWESSSSQGQDRLVLLAIARGATRYSQISWISFDALASVCQTSPQSVEQSIVSLMQAGELEELDASDGSTMRPFRVVRTSHNTRSRRPKGTPSE
ncbi:hypothetical protein [Kocuria sp.]|uniref:hypothetical protein n=1 Tax=Kocuria sp. TaxID=1871328 RepID=UPI0026DDB55D|nr:hypothetical protein [Kocuria sp.]MDO4920065.1 hypothetical protein [Kocuria sp.]